jgi:hypothetical protein
MSQATTADAVPATNDKPLQKRPHRIPLKKALPSRYSDTVSFLTCELVLF